MAKDFSLAFYTSAAWRRCRRQVLRRDLFTCVYCDDRASEVHHIVELTPQNILDENIALNPDNLLSLCHLCHQKVTAGTGDIQEGYLFDDDGNVIRR